mmetsp:Transcript_8760/g.28807  ORF Transcript_8760/g.28807 Transcript_8760/m.28807 type:complete len:233 (+) Transcript_8760:24-722(+)
MRGGDLSHRILLNTALLDSVFAVDFERDDEREVVAWVHFVGQAVPERGIVLRGHRPRIAHPRSAANHHVINRLREGRRESGESGLVPACARLRKSASEAAPAERLEPALERVMGIRSWETIRVNPDCHCVKPTPLRLLRLPCAVRAERLHEVLRLEPLHVCVSWVPEQVCAREEDAPRSLFRALALAVVAPELDAREEANAVPLEPCALLCRLRTEPGREVVELHVRRPVYR